MTIYEIKQRSEETNPYFFSRKTLQFFGQTLKSFSVKKHGDGYLISAKMYDYRGSFMGLTQRIFNPETNTLDTV